MVSAADSFLSAYNDIDKYLRNRFKRDYNTSFTQLVKDASPKLRVVNRFYQELIDYGQLRNAIVHSYTKDKIIATPLQETADSIQRIKDLIINTPKAYQTFKKDVLTINSENTLSEALEIMEDSFISQIPIIKDGVVIEILNGNTVARWLSSNVIVSTKETLVEELIPHIELSENYIIVNRDTDVYEVAYKFTTTTRRGWYLDAVFITQDGKPDQKLLGMAVIEDLAPYINQT